MPSPLLQRLEKRRFDDLRGTQLHLELPVARTLLNWYIHQLESQAIRHVEVISIRGTEMAVNVQTNIPFFKDRTVTARFNERIDRLVLRVELTDGINFVERSLLRPFLPDGLDLDGRELTVDLGYFLQRNPRLAFWTDKIHNTRVAGGRERLLFICDVAI
jgi:hypothetical protein